MSSVASTSDSPSSPTLSERAAEATELKEALTTRLQYARFKSNNAPTRQSLAEVENLNFSPFAKQAAERKAKKLELLIQDLQGSKQIQGDQRERGGEKRWEKIEWFQPVDVKMSEVMKGKQREFRGTNPEETPTPSSTYDQPFPVLYLAICPAKPPSRARTASDTSVETVVEEQIQEALPNRQNEPEFTPQPPDFDTRSYTATEMLAFRHRNDFSPSSSSLLHRPHHRHSPFSHTMTTTLAPASSSSTINVPSALAPLSSHTPSQPNSQESSTTSSSQSSAQSITLNLASQASFSALPPPPPLEFGAGTLGGFLHPPASSQQRRQEQRIRRIMDEAPGSSQEEPTEPERKRTRIASNEDGPTSSSSSSPPPVSSFPFSLTQSQSSSSTLPPSFPSSSQSVEGGGGYYYNYHEERQTEETGEEEGESQETQTTEGGGEESQETDLEESQKMYDNQDGGRSWSMRT